MQLTSVMEKFIVHWGEMGTRWGVNRTVAQIHALLYLSSQPLNAEEISETLGVARSNVSTSLKELMSWRLVKVNHVLGDRRDHFESSKDLWEIFNCVVEERKKREIDPTLTILRQCELEAANDKTTPEEIKQRIKNMTEFLETLTDWYEQMSHIPKTSVMKLLKLGSKVTKLLGK
ncbi:MAG: MarR family transcriptional regulator [Gammaproteobacteria bacterium]|nr:MarR family transcriptional regulator [Gammaproteobacteria bacterium]MDH5800423.1 MarR family transcriptional regulator [Gammaproteobacteria bacterium]